MKPIKPIRAIAFLITCSLLFSCQKEDPFINNPPSIDDQVFSVDENSPNGTVVGTVVALDADKNQVLTYSLLLGNSDNAFKIDSLTGVISVNNSLALDYEVKTSFELAIKVRDNYNESLSNCAIVTININNLNEYQLTGLVAYYPFNGNANDETGNNHNGTAYNATLTTDRNNKPNSAYLFNGFSSYINTLSTFDYPYRTVSVWVNASEISNASPNNYAVIAQDDPSLQYGTLAVSFDAGNLRINAGGSSSSDIYISSQYTINHWYHLVIVRDGMETRYYINGDLKHKGISGSLTSNSGSAQLLIGVGRSKTLQFFKGKIDDLVVYNRAISQKEITELYNNY